MKFRKNFLLVSLLILSSLFYISCNDEANGQDDNNTPIDFQQHITSGTVLINQENNNYILDLVIAQDTVFFEESPGIRAGVIETETFAKELEVLEDNLELNSVLSLIEEDGTLITVPLTINSVKYNQDNDSVSYEVFPLEITSNPGNSTTLIPIGELESPFGNATLFIDGLASVALCIAKDLADGDTSFSDELECTLSY